MESNRPLGLRGVLGITAFRRLWIALSLSSLGDWLGLLAQSALAKSLAHGYAQQSYAVAGVFALRLIPAILFGPIAGVVADRLDRRWTMVIGDSVRCLLFISIAVAGSLWWLFAATFLIEVAAMFWIPAKEATVPNLVPRASLESANQLSLLTAYGSAPFAAGIFTLLALVTKVLARHWTFFTANPVNLSFYFDALTFLFSALTIAFLSGIPRGAAVDRAAGRHIEAHPLRALFDGWRFIGDNRKIRGLIIGITGAFSAGGAVVGLANTYVSDLDGGQAGYGVLFGSVFLGLAGGMFSGPHVLTGISRERMFGAAIGGAGLTLCVLSLIPNLVLSTVCALVIGFLGGVAWITGQTMLGRDVADELRGRTFAFVQSLIRICLVLILALAPAIAGTIGRKRVRLPGSVSVTYGGAAITLFCAGLVALGVGWVAYRMMDNVPGKPLRTELMSALRRAPHPGPEPDSSSSAPTGKQEGPAGLSGSGAAYPGYFVCFEGGDGSGKSTQLSAVADWLRGKGHEVVATREPGGTLLGGKLREIVLDARHADAISPRAEALIYAADRADHVERVIRPALERGAIVLTDRYVDSSLAYQGAGRALPTAEIAQLSAWATAGLKPDLTILLDLDPITAAQRRSGPADRLEAESLDFHTRVRERYLELATAEPDRYLVIDAGEPASEITGRIKGHLDDLLPSSPRETAEERRRREALETEAARVEAERQAEQTAEERRLAQIEAERQEQARAADLKRTAAARAHREKLEEEARRIERAAAERAREAAARDLAGSIVQADASAATPEEISAAARASAQAAATAAQAAAAEISTPPTRSEWDIPNYVGEPEIDPDHTDDDDALSLADELFGARKQPGE